MNKLMLATCVVALGSAALVDCAGGPPAGPPIRPLLHPPFQCPAGGCDVYVGARTDASGVCRVSVSDEAIEVGPGKSPVVTWVLNSFDGQEYQFKVDTGIAFKPDNVPPATPDDFDNGHRVGKTKFSWHSVNRRPGIFYYSVDVQRVIDSQHVQDCVRLDPRIANDGP